MPDSLNCLFYPESIAVVGASRKRGTVGSEIFHNLLAHGFPGPVYPVNPSTRVVHSVRTYPTVRAIPDEIDLVVIVVPAEYVREVVDDCVAKGVKGVIIVSAGFGEIGPAGQALQDEIVRTVRDNNIRMVGPNCLGLLNTDPECRVNATFAPNLPGPGPIAFSSQSGALGVTILDHAKNLGIGVRHFISVGNKADVSSNDLLEYWEHDPEVRVIMLYLESFGNPRRFMKLARRITRRKPILVVKSGSTEAGARAASSHTGSLAGLDVAVDALLGQAGVLRATTIEGLFDLAMLIANQPVPRGNRVAIVTNAGGPGIMAADACASHRLLLPNLSAETEAKLRAFLPAEASVGNPIDMLASAGADDYERSVRMVLADPGIDALMVLFVPPIMIEATQIAEAIRRGAQGTSKPVLTSFMGTHGVPEALCSLRQGNFPSYAFPEAAARALARASQSGDWLSREVGDVPERSDVRANDAYDIITRRRADGWMPPDDVWDLLSAYGIRTPRGRVVPTVDEAEAAATQLGFPVALKLVSDRLTHKTDVGGVALGLENAPAVRAAHREMTERLAAQGQLDAMDGVLVQEMLPPAVEVFIGAMQDPKFGPLIGFGIGGINVEIWRDIVFRVHPLTDVDARQMLGRIRGAKLLDGYRGSPPADREAVMDVLHRVSRMVGDLPQIMELDINPLLAFAPGKGVMAVDARVRIRQHG